MGIQLGNENRTIVIGEKCAVKPHVSCHEFLPSAAFLVCETSSLEGIYGKSLDCGDAEEGGTMCLLFPVFDHQGVDGSPPSRKARVLGATECSVKHAVACGPQACPVTRNTKCEESSKEVGGSENNPKSNKAG